MRDRQAALFITNGPPAIVKALPPWVQALALLAALATPFLACALVDLMT